MRTNLKLFLFQDRVTTFILRQENAKYFSVDSQTGVLLQHHHITLTLPEDGYSGLPNTFLQTETSATYACTTGHSVIFSFRRGTVRVPTRLLLHTFLISLECPCLVAHVLTYAVWIAHYSPGFTLPPLSWLCSRDPRDAVRFY